jgi:hypothetical protein
MSTKLIPEVKQVKDRSIQVRLTSIEYEILASKAATQKTTMASLLRAYMHEGLAGFDRKHEVVLDELRSTRNALELTRKLSASAIGALALLDVPRHNATAIQDIKKNLDESFGLAKATDQLMDQFLKNTAGGA